MPRQLRWIREAAEQGGPNAQFKLGSLYRFGEGGGRRDKSEALKWHHRAAEQGEDIAQSNLGHMYRSKDIVEAYKWFTLAEPRWLNRPLGGGIFCN